MSFKSSGADSSIPQDESSSELASRLSSRDDGSLTIPSTTDQKKSKSKRKKLKKNFKKVLKIAKHPITSAIGATGQKKDQVPPIDEISPFVDESTLQKGKKKKDKKRKKKKLEEFQSDDEDVEGDFVSLVKYEKAKYALADKSDLVDTLFSKIQLLEETIREKDEVILRLQNIDILQRTIQEKNEIIHKLQLHDEVPKNTFTNEFKSNAKLLNEIRKKKRELENFRTDFRYISSGSSGKIISDENADEKQANSDNLFFYWKRQDNKINDATTDPDVELPVMSKSVSAEVAKTKRLESSDLLHRLRKEKTTVSAPQKKAAEPWKAVHTFLLPVNEKSVAERTLIREALENNYVFENLNEASIGSFIQAFENVQVRKGHVLMKEGNTVDYFYIVADGQVATHKDDGKVKLSGPGTCIGESSLLYASARNSTVVANAEPTRLFRVDQKTFRYTMRRTVKAVNRKKMDLLKSIKVLQAFDPPDLQRLCDNMVGKCIQFFELVTISLLEASHSALPRALR